MTPPEEVLSLVEALPRPKLPSLRWTTPDQWHVTLRFLGEVEEPAPVAEALRTVPEKLRESQTETIEAVLGPAVAWFTSRRILQIPVHGTEALAEVVSEATERWGEADHRPYAGHLTLARVRGMGKGPVNLAGTPVKGAWRVDELFLMSSSLGEGGARYETLEAVTLGS